ncbi:MAG TPA: DUF3300 domain-containing protein [Burkholderiaceae bacterium]
MARILQVMLVCLAACLSPAAQAQTEQQALFSQSDLDQMLASVALYPDDLLSNVLTAATYPLEVVQADRYLKQNPNLQGNALADALNSQPWDASVKSLAQFPSVLAMMDDELSWTEQLGDAFLAQPTDVMDAVQGLRAKAAANGTLQSDTQELVQSQGDDITIQPAQPDVVYVPYYDPVLVFGTWWWPSQPPVFWNPPPAYRPYNFGNVGSGGIAYGSRVALNGTGFVRFRPNWGARTISVRNPHRGNAVGTPWQHDPGHRLGVAYRTQPTVNRVVQQAAPSRQQQVAAHPAVAQPVQAAQPQFAPRTPQPETYRPLPAPMPAQPQRVEMPVPRPAAVPAQPEARPAPAPSPVQRGEASRSEPIRNNDAHK